jgi:drug/metabolite transporter superfamily protein YnfA
VLTAKQTFAIGRKYGAHRGVFVCTDDQHDFAKVNWRI